MSLSAKVAAIEIVDNEARIAVVRSGLGLPVVLELQTAQAAPAGEDDRFEALAQAVREAVGRVRSRPSAWVLCAPSEWGVVRSITVPFKGRRRVAAAVQFELEPYLAFPIEQLVVDFTVVREIEGETEVLAFGLQRDPVEQQLAVLEAAGLDPDGINIGAIGLAALWHKGQRGLTGLNAALHVRKNGSVLTVVNGKSLAYLRLLPSGVLDIQQSPRAAAREVRNSVRAFLAGWKGQAEVSRLSVTGLDLFEEERHLFEEEFRMPVEFNDLLAPLKGAVRARERAAAGASSVAAQAEDAAGDAGNYWTAAIGVADCSTGGRYALNFRKGELRQRRPFRGMASRIAFSTCLAVILIAAYAGYCYLDYRANLAQTERIGAEIWALFEESFPDSPLAEERPSSDVGGGRSFELMQEEVNNRSNPASTLPVEMFNRTRALDVLAEIAAKMPGDKVAITRLSMSGGRRPEIRISGEAKDSAAFSEVFGDLMRSTVFDVDEDRLSRSTIGDKETFTIVATWL